MLLLDFNYFFNKAINQYVNKRYNVYDTSLLTTDDLRVLKATQKLTPHKIDDTKNEGMYYINLPLDYLHILNCICVYKVHENFKCYNAGDLVQFAAKRLTGDSWSVILNDYYNRPLPERPYFYINNVNTSETRPTNPILDSDLKINSQGTDSPIYKVYSIKTDSDFYHDPPVHFDNTNNILKGIREGDLIRNEYSGTINKFIVTEIKDKDVIVENTTLPIPDYAVGTTKVWITGDLPRTIEGDDQVERKGTFRYGNSSSIRCEIRYGKDNTLFELAEVLIDYIKVPLTIRLTQELVDLTRDTSQIMEFPDYVCLEIINELVHLVMENTADPRILTHAAITLSIANPAQVQKQPTMTRALLLATS